MDVSVYYRGAMNKLHYFVATDVESYPAAIKLVEDFAKEDDMFAKKPFLALVKGGKQ